MFIAQNISYQGGLLTLVTCDSTATDVQRGLLENRLRIMRIARGTPD